MKIIQILNARDSLAKINKIKFDDFNITFKVFKLTKRVNEILEVVKVEQNKLISEYVITDNNGVPEVNGHQYMFKDPDAENKYLEEYKSLLNTSASLIEPIEIPLSSVKSAADISTEDLFKLDPLIKWSE